MANAVSPDQNFKDLILDYPRDALTFFAPAEAPAPDDDVDIVPVRQEQARPDGRVGSFAGAKLLRRKA